MVPALTLITTLATVLQLAGNLTGTPTKLTGVPAHVIGDAARVIRQPWRSTQRGEPADEPPRARTATTYQMVLPRALSLLHRRHTATRKIAQLSALHRAHTATPIDLSVSWPMWTLTATPKIRILNSRAIVRGSLGSRCIGQDTARALTATPHSCNELGCNP